jgi:hypothetical protein
MITYFMIVVSFGLRIVEDDEAIGSF